MTQDIAYAFVLGSAFTLVLLLGFALHIERKKKK